MWDVTFPTWRPCGCTKLPSGWRVEVDRLAGAQPLLGVAVALAVLLVDQASKQWLLFVYDIEARQPVHLGPFLDVVLARNRGISYSLFTTDTADGRMVLLGVTLVATLALAVWLWRTRKTLVAVALGLLIGGALGNAYDRWALGAVTDFVWFHVGRFSWYIFNGADVAICAGVAILIVESFFGGSARPAKKMP